MDRRKFIKTGIKAGIVSGLSFSATSVKSSDIIPGNTDLVIIKGGQPDSMFTKGIEILGGIRKFISKDDSVVVKPDMGHNRIPQQGETTHPLLVKQIIEQCYEAGAGEVLVFDHTYGTWTKCYKNSGIERIAKDAYARVLPANDERYYTKMQSPLPKILKSVKIHEALIKADVLINVPMLKQDPLTKIVAGIKNLMGCVWDREFYFQNGLDQCLAEFLFYKKPHLNVTDAYYTTIDNKEIHMQLITTDIVAADAYGSKVMGLYPEDVPHIEWAFRLGFGEISTEKLAIKQLNISN